MHRLARKHLHRAVVANALGDGQACNQQHGYGDDDDHDGHGLFLAASFPGRERTAKPTPTP